MCVMRLLYSSGMLAYFGTITMTSAPASTSARGSDPATSPRPPVFTKGAASADAMTICIFFPVMGTPLNSSSTGRRAWGTRRPKTAAR